MFKTLLQWFFYFFFLRLLLPELLPEGSSAEAREQPGHQPHNAVHLVRLCGKSKQKHKHTHSSHTELHPVYDGLKLPKYKNKWLNKCVINIPLNAQYVISAAESLSIKTKQKKVKKRGIMGVFTVKQLPSPVKLYHCDSCSNVHRRGFKVSFVLIHFQWLLSSLSDSLLEVVATGDQMDPSVTMWLS